MNQKHYFRVSQNLLVTNLLFRISNPISLFLCDDNAAFEFQTTIRPAENISDELKVR